MSLTTILVHLASDDDHVARLEAATKLARRHKAKLFALFIANPIGMPAPVTGRGASSVYIAEATRKAREVARGLEQEFRDRCRRDNIDCSWLVVEGDHIELMAKHAHVADLIIASQPTIEYLEDHFRERLPDELVMHSGLPVLLLPKGFDAKKEIGKTVVVAWKDTRETVRAVRDSLSILREADKVMLLAIGAELRDTLSELEVLDYLRRQGIEAKPHHLLEGESTPGQTILDFSQSHGADLIVMGAYGHSRLRQVILGGVTRHITRNSEIPVLMGH